MQPVLDMVSRVGPSDANILITGEPGSGKEVVARTLHAISSRASKPMVTVNAGGLAEGVFESELFGHIKGAFTDAKMDRVGRFELADTRHVISGRDRKRADEPASETAACPRDWRDGARWFVENKAGRCSRHLGYQCKVDR